jgi:hypothetical protein
MPTVRAFLAAALLALIGAFAPAIADPTRRQCQAEDAIPEFVTRRVELIAAGRFGEPRGVPAVELEQDPICLRGLRTEP